MHPFVTRKSTFLVSVSVIAVFSFIIIDAAQAQAQTQMPSREEFQQAHDNAQQAVVGIHKFTTVLSACTAKLSSPTPEVVRACMDIINGFKSHIDSFFTEQDSNIREIMGFSMQPSG